ncbi:hypothetical protein [Kitasatospora sp. GP82]|uniref:hypothetical protein n=1 Tax=Kitasatospora sp. GP82 TaxID=3035089 RepID=UPI0024733953|nr:hypothetical protein [Kitasatospora sp. GP82]MDH6129008.1 hypothetical protein [Kitasatospora sp. GP82]
MAGSTRTAKTYEEYKAERRKQVIPSKGWRPLDDYDPATAARLLSVRGTPRDWHFCECGSEKCPDKGKADGSALGLHLSRSIPPAVNDAA